MEIVDKLLLYKFPYLFQDTHEVSSTMERVNLWSSLHLGIMLLVGLLQVRGSRFQVF
jgi:hypothetical protein